MKTHHTAALALVGWYLMTPPLGPNGSIDPNAPLSRWEEFEGYDSAAACEVEHNHLLDLANLIQRNLQKSEESLTQKLNGISREQLESANPEKLREFNRQLDETRISARKIQNYVDGDRASRCVATDDPRLKGQ
jgi:hypothetical protein